MTVTGIEISQTAIDLVHKHFGADLKIHHGSITEMPFDQNRYDGIYCYALIHLLDENERKKLIQDCLNQLSPGGYMVFAVATKDAPLYGQGTCIAKDRFQVHGGIKMFFYDKEIIQQEFGNAGLFEISEVDDVYPFYLIKCQRARNYEKWIVTSKAGFVLLGFDLAIYYFPSLLLCIFAIRIFFGYAAAFVR